jgi:hypothetical protein
MDDEHDPQRLVTEIQEACLKLAQLVHQIRQERLAYESDDAGHELVAERRQ